MKTIAPRILPSAPRPFRTLAGAVMMFGLVPGPARVQTAEASTCVSCPGILDANFPDVNVSGQVATGSIPDAIVYATAVQPDGKIIIGGNFNSVGGQPRGTIARLNSDGTLDGSFVAATNGYVQALTVQPDGKILVVGFFTQANGIARSCVARFNSHGSLDGGFATGTVFNSTGPTPQLYGVALQADSKILICGLFTSVDGAARGGIARLNADGSLDTSFNLIGAKIDNTPGAVFSMALTPAGKIFVGGTFTKFNQMRQRRCYPPTKKPRASSPRP